MADDSSTLDTYIQFNALDSFHSRLNKLLEFRGYIEHSKKIERLVTLTQRKLKTVEKWLSGKSVPRGYTTLDIVEGLGLFRCGRWLAYGVGINPIENQFLDNMSQWPAWKKNKFLRLAMRLVNNDSKAKRLMEMFDRGQITQQQLLEAM